MGDLGDTVYRELHAIARRRLAARQAGHTLQPTALINEAWLRLRGQLPEADPSPAFFRTAAEAMRHILIDHARRKKRLKRGGGAARDSREPAEIADSLAPEDAADFEQIVALNEALERLERLDPQTAEVVKLRFFGGLTVEETAACLGVGERTVKREWSFARVWLAKELSATT